LTTSVVLTTSICEVVELEFEEPVVVGVVAQLRLPVRAVAGIAATAELLADVSSRSSPFR